MDYQALYYRLFNTYTDILEALKAQNYGQAKAFSSPDNRPARSFTSARRMLRRT